MSQSSIRVIKPRANSPLMLSHSGLHLIFNWISDKKSIGACQIVCKDWMDAFIQVYMVRSSTIAMYLSSLCKFSENHLLPSIRESLDVPHNDEFRQIYINYAREYFSRINHPEWSVLLHPEHFNALINMLKCKVIHIQPVYAISNILKQKIMYTIFVLIKLYYSFATSCDTIRIANFYLEVSLSSLQMNDGSIVQRTKPPRNTLVPFAMRIFSEERVNRPYSPMWSKFFIKMNAIKQEISNPNTIEYSIDSVKTMDELWHDLPKDL